MIQEFSAGGIVYRKSKVNGQQSKVFWLIAQHAQHKGWVFPKGLIGDEIPDETKEDAAIREVTEETGIEARIMTELPIPITYWYEREGKRIHKTVYLYLMKYVSGDFDDRDDEMMDVKWATEQNVMNTLTYENDKIAFEKALKIIKNVE